jgi:1-deoxy-D-xylulose-5-phosphate synthase
MLRDGEDIAIIGIGTMANVAMSAAERSTRSVAVYDIRYTKPLDTELIESIGAKFSHIVTIEDGIIRGGVGEAIVAHLARKGYTANVKTLGIDDLFVHHGKPAELYAECGYDKEALLKVINNI